jgi:hypothetical protein|tara:strand:+ start:22952 stop:23413 length:462 start_codon:yes stop_codon:yes gene_type:complete
MKSLIIVLFFPCVIFAQSKIYLGDRPNRNDLIYQITENKITRMSTSLWGTDILTVRNNQVFDNSFNSNVRYTIEGNKVYRGQSTSVFDLLYEIENGKVYQISNSSLKKVVYTFSDGRIYVGDSTSTFDCLFSYELAYSGLRNEILLFLAIAPF